MTNEITKIVFMMSVENMHGREMLTWLLNFSFPITAIIIEHKSKRAERVRNARYNEYNPKSFNEIIKNHSIKIHYVENHNDEETISLLNNYKPDYIVLGGTRILKDPIINTVKFGVLNSHPALLPKYQGLDCVSWSILNGDPVGATVHLIDAGIDSGPIILQDNVDYSDCSNLGEVRVKVMKKCAELVVKSLIGLKFNTLKPIIQNLSLGINHTSLPLEKLELVERKILEQKKNN